MRKKINYFGVIPIFGSVIIIFYLYLRMWHKKINKKKYNAILLSCGIVGFLSILFVILVLNIIDSVVDITTFNKSYGLIVSFIIGGYLMNGFTIILFNKENLNN